MENIQIETTQNVTLEYQIASVGDRLLANMYDGILLLTYIIVIIIIQVTTRILSNDYAIIVILFLPYFIYDLVCELVMNGQSYGKRLRKIKVVKLDGTQPGFTNYFLRWILRPIDSFFMGGIAILSIILNGKGQRLGDIAAGTTVIKIKEDVSLSDTIFTELNDNYEAKYPEVVNLTDTEIGIVKEVIERFRSSDDLKNGSELLIKTKNVLSKKMQITTEMEPLTFLNTILKDYNKVHGK